MFELESPSTGKSKALNIDSRYMNTCRLRNPSSFKKCTASYKNSHEKKPTFEKIIGQHVLLERSLRIILL
jgi:hypothetical protein